MRIIKFFIVAAFILAIGAWVNPNTVYADGCEDICFAQQNTCMKGCSSIKDTDNQNSCVRGCLRGGTACANRCRQKGELRIFPDELMRAAGLNDTVNLASCMPRVQSCRP